jgi:hypothetical protein
MWPKLFGPYIWPLLHLHAYRYSSAAPHEQAAIRRYFADLPAMLPCPGCQMHAAAYLKEHPVDLARLFHWSVDFHNSVNKRTGKREFTYDEAFKDLHAKFFDVHNMLPKVDDEKMLKLYREEKLKSEEEAERWKNAMLMTIIMVIVASVFICVMMIIMRIRAIKTSSSVGASGP